MDSVHASVPMQTESHGGIHTVMQDQQALSTPLDYKDPMQTLPVPPLSAAKTHLYVTHRANATVIGGTIIIKLLMTCCWSLMFITSQSLQLFDSLHRRPKQPRLMWILWNQKRQALLRLYRDQRDVLIIMEYIMCTSPVMFMKQPEWIKQMVT